MLQASGDLVPFDIMLSRDGTDEKRRVSGTLEGGIEVHDDARENRRRDRTSALRCVRQIGPTGFRDRQADWRTAASR